MLTHEEVLARRRQRYAEPREEERDRRRASHARHRDSELESGRRWREANKEKYIEYNKRRYQEHKERFAELHRQTYLRNREHYIEYSRKWRLAHPDAHRLHVKRCQKARQERLRDEAEQRKAATAFFQGIALMSAVTTADESEINARSREVSEARKAVDEQRRQREKAWKSEWQKRNREKQRLYKQRWKERLMADPERLEAYREHERERRRTRNRNTDNQSTA